MRTLIEEHELAQDSAARARDARRGVLLGHAFAAAWRAGEPIAHERLPDVRERTPWRDVWIWGETELARNRTAAVGAGRAERAGQALLELARHGQLDDAQSWFERAADADAPEADKVFTPESLVGDGWSRSDGTWRQRE